MANSFGIATIWKEYNNAGRFIDALGGAIGLGAGAAASGGVGAVIGAGIALSAPWVLSKLLSNPRYVNAAWHYAENAKTGNMSGIITEKRKMKRLFLEMMAKESPEVIKDQTTQKNPPPLSNGQIPR